MSDSDELSGDIWQRTHGTNELSWSQFYGLFFISTIFALFFTGCITWYGTGMHLNPWLTLFIGLAGGIGGILIAYKSYDPWISFIGLLVLAGSIGIELTTLMEYYQLNAQKYQYNFSELIVQTMLLTAVATTLMGILGFIFADFFIGLGGILFGALCGLLVLSIGQIILSFFGITFDSMWLTWAGVIIFCGYVGFDIGRVRKLTFTADNAVDASLALYLDIINLFVRFLRIMAKSKRN